MLANLIQGANARFVGRCMREGTAFSLGHSLGCRLGGIAGRALCWGNLDGAAASICSDGVTAVEEACLRDDDDDGDGGGGGCDPTIACCPNAPLCE